MPARSVCSPRPGSADVGKEAVVEGRQVVSSRARVLAILAPRPLLAGKRHTLYDVSLDSLGPMGHVVFEGLTERSNEVVRIE